jgi:hypothetical protein
MPARRADETSRRIRLQPPLAFAPIPDAILRTEHPSAAFAVEDREVAHRDPERSRRQAAIAPLVDEQLVSRFGIGKRIDGHPQSMPPHLARLGGGIRRQV